MTTNLHYFNTPPELLDLVRQLDPKGIGLDPCSNKYSMTDAHIECYGPDPTPTYNGGSDGLVISWRGHGLVFMNPPHSTSPHNIEPWMEKAYNEFWDHTMLLEGLSSAERRKSNTPTTDQFVGLIPAKTDTAWFHDFAVEFPVKCFLRGRPNFWLNGAPMPGPGKFASMLIYAGNHPDLFTKVFAPMGWIV